MNTFVLCWCTLLIPSWDWTFRDKPCEEAGKEEDLLERSFVCQTPGVVPRQLALCVFQPQSFTGRFSGDEFNRFWESLSHGKINLCVRALSPPVDMVLLYCPGVNWCSCFFFMQCWGKTIFIYLTKTARERTTFLIAAPALFPRTTRRQREQKSYKTSLRALYFMFLDFTVLVPDSLKLAPVTRIPLRLISIRSEKSIRSRFCLFLSDKNGSLDTQAVLLGYWFHQHRPCGHPPETYKCR